MEATAPNGKPYYSFSQHSPALFLSWPILGPGCLPQVRLDDPTEHYFIPSYSSHQTPLVSFRKAGLPESRQIF